MAGFWFLVSVILFIILVSRKKNDGKDYAQGYWDGYREFGAQVQNLITKRRIDTSSLQKLIDEGTTGAVSSEENLVPQPEVTAPEDSWSTVEDDFVTDVIGEAPADSYAQQVQPTTVVQPRYNQTVQSPVVAMTPEEEAKRSLRNLNLILYIASFLLVAAGALFVASSSSAMVKLIGVCIIIAIFYLAGYIIYTKVERLRPAGLAFLGTGLALIPFAGFAFQDFSNLSATTSWLITSIVGLVAYFAAAILLQSQLVSYLTMAFVLSLVGSTTATGTQAIVWQFVAIIGISLIASIVAYFKPQWLPSIFSRPIEHTGQIVTPVALVASLTIFDRLRITDYEIVFAIATLHYVVAWLQSRTITYETIVRVLAYIVVSLLVWDVTESSLAAFSFAMVLLLSFQHAYSLIMVNRPGYAHIERVWIGVLFTLQILLMLNWQTYLHSALFTTVSLLVIGMTSYAAALRLRSVGVGVIGLAVSLIAPFTVARSLFSVPLPWWVLAAWFGAAAILALWGYAKFQSRSKKLRVFITTAYILYVFLALVTAHVNGGSILLLVAYSATAAFALVASYVARAPYAQLFVPLFVFTAVASIVQLLKIEPLWIFLCIGGGSATVLWLLAAMHGIYGQSLRQILMTTSGLIVFLSIIGTLANQGTQLDGFILTLLLLTAFGSLVLRWVYKDTKPSLSSVFACAYPIYFAVTVLVATTAMGTGLVAIVMSTGIALFMAASYVEREKWVQIVSAILTIITLGLVAKLVPLPYEWHNLFMFGLSAVLFYAAAGLHYAYKQSDRQFLMTSTAYITLFFVAFTGMTGGYQPRLAAFAILLVWSVMTLALRWWSRDRSTMYNTLFQAAYPIYYVAALLLASTLSATWVAVAFAAGACLTVAASYAERMPKLEITSGILVILALVSLTHVIDLPIQWFLLFIFGIAAGIFCLAAGYHRGSGETYRQLMMTALAQITLIWIAFTVSTGHATATLTAFVVLLSWSLISLALRWWSRDRSREYSGIFRAAYLVYYPVTLLMTFSMAPIWGIIALAIGAVVFWVASYAERAPFVVVLGNALLVAALVYFWWWTNLSLTWMVLGISWILAGLFYFGHWIFKGLHDTVRNQILLWSTWAVLLYASFMQSLAGSLQIATMATLIVFAMTLAMDGVQRKSRGMVEAAAYIATFGVQRIVAIIWPELNIVFYGHWWAITLVLVALFSRTHRQMRFVIAAALVTASSGVYALTSGKEYQLLFLIEHLALLVAGAILSKNWAIWWGIVATALAIVYFLRTYTFLLLGFLGLLLIAIVVWRLMRSSNATNKNNLE
jgi:hypothetical protein